VDWIQLHQDSYQCAGPVNVIMILRLIKKEENLLIRCVAISC
jgi:hypothetical protein